MIVVNRLMYTGSADSSAKCWVTEFGDCTRQYKGHKHSVICMKFHKGVCTFGFFTKHSQIDRLRDFHFKFSDSLFFKVFTGCGDGVARAYDAKSATLKRVFHGHEGAINCLVVVDEKLYTGSSDGTMRVWDAKDISDDINIDEEPPPAPPPAAVVPEQDLEKQEEDLEEAPEDGIIDDDDKPEESIKTEEDNAAAEEVLSSG